MYQWSLAGRWSILQTESPLISYSYTLNDFYLFWKACHEVLFYRANYCKSFSCMLTLPGFLYILRFSTKFHKPSYFSGKFNSRNRNSTHCVSILKHTCLVCRKTSLSVIFHQVSHAAKKVVLCLYSGTCLSINHVHLYVFIVIQNRIHNLYF